MAEDDDRICNSPFDFELAPVVLHDSETREDIGGKQGRDLLKQIKEHKCFSDFAMG